MSWIVAAAAAASCCLWLLLLLRWLKPSVHVGSHTRMYWKKVTEELVESKICIQPQLRQSCIQEIFVLSSPVNHSYKSEDRVLLFIRRQYFGGAGGRSKRYKNLLDPKIRKPVRFKCTKTFGSKRYENLLNTKQAPPPPPRPDQCQSPIQTMKAAADALWRGVLQATHLAKGTSSVS